VHQCSDQLPEGEAPVRVVALELANGRVRVRQRGLGPARREIDQQPREVGHVLEQGSGLRITPQTAREARRFIPAAQRREPKDLVPSHPGHPRVPLRRVRAVPALGQFDHLVEPAGPEQRLGEEHARKPLVPGVVGLAVPGNRIAQGLEGAFVLAGPPLELPFQHPDRRQPLDIGWKLREPPCQELRRCPKQDRALARDGGDGLAPTLCSEPVLDRVDPVPALGNGRSDRGVQAPAFIVAPPFAEAVDQELPQQRVVREGA
jgi:hypothetical protein